MFAHEVFDVNCSNSSGMLPQTGGFSFALPVFGVALLTGGAGLLALSGRRRRY
jgi:LPXTG-motif cell wall-anchored protein